jgi:1-pyrroline-2-carboxylate reductase [NAD(P)H]
MLSQHSPPSSRPHKPVNPPQKETWDGRSESKLEKKSHRGRPQRKETDHSFPEPAPSGIVCQRVTMQIISSEKVQSTLEYPGLIDELDKAFAASFTMPQRTVFQLDETAETHDGFALLPAWNDQVIALKSFTYFPDNQTPHKTLYSKILLFDRQHGEPLALVDGTSVTFWRTGGVSALAARYLARKDSRTLVILGTGNLAPYLARAHTSALPLAKVLIWGRNQAKAQQVVDSIAIPDVEISVATDLEAACAQADILVSATGSPDILVHGDWIRPGTHTDFLGNHIATRRECDSKLIQNARVFVDTYANCLQEAGEILLPMKEGVFAKEDLQGELAELCAGSVPGRTTDSEITLFKSVGNALSDLVAANCAYLG